MSCFLQDLCKTSLGLLLVKGETSVKLVAKNKKEWVVKCIKIGVLSLGWIEFACAHLLMREMFAYLKSSMLKIAP